MSYNFKEIEKKWQDKWYTEGTFNAKDDFTMKKWFGLIEFPYPSGQGLHVGHPRSYTALDIIARKRRMQGYNVLFPIGFDAFGLPAENYAIKNHIHPKITTEKNINHFREQLKSIGFSFDWSREINTTDPEYYKWTQWIFIQLYKHRLAYKATMPINFCTGCKVGLANEEVVNGVCERCGSPVVQKEKSQWMLKITEYAQRLIDDLDDVDFLDKIKAQQKNWIGRSEGAEVTFKISDSDETLTVYTTRPDTLFGATYMVVAPEHHIIDKLSNKITNMDEIQEYKHQASLKSDFERSELNKEKTGCEIKGIKAINPLTNEEIPIWISDYVLITYGTGSIMAVPGHDTRDHEFAKKFHLPIVQVIKPVDETIECDIDKEAFTDVETGILINSGFLNDLSVVEAKKKIIDFLENNHIGKKQINYKLRDWVFSRQRYWGEPIPMVYCEKCGWVPIPEEELPLKLPEVEDYEPSENGESPLAKHTDWVNTTCPHCGGHMVDILVLDGRDERLKFLGLDGILTATCCPNCVGFLKGPAFNSFTLDGDVEVFPSELFDGEDKMDCYVRPEDYKALADNLFVLGKMSVPLFYGAASEDVNTIGGFANWVQDWEYTTCPHCGKPMKYLAQIQWDTLFDGTEGTLYIEFCPDCKIVSMQHQQT